MYQQGDFGVQFAERGESGERHLHEVAHATYVHEHLIRSLVGETSAKLANHRRRVLSTAATVSTQGTTLRCCLFALRISAHFASLRYLFPLLPLRQIERARIASGKTRRGLLE